MFEFLHLRSINATESNNVDILETRMEKLMTQKNVASKANKIQYDVCILVFNLQKTNAEFDNMFVNMCKDFLAKIIKSTYHYKQCFTSCINNTKFLASFIHHYSEHKKLQESKQSAEKDIFKKEDPTKQGIFKDFSTKLDFNMPKSVNEFNGLHKVVNEQSFRMFDVFCDNSQKCDFLFRSIEAKTKNIALKNVFILVFDNDLKTIDNTCMLNFLIRLNLEAYKAKQNTNLEAFLIFNLNFLSVCFDFAKPKLEFAKSLACIKSMYIKDNNDLCENLKTENFFILNIENKMLINCYKDGINMEDLENININIIKPAYFFRNILIDENYVMMYSIEFRFYNVRYFFYIYLKEKISQIKGRSTKNYMIFYLENLDIEPMHVFSYSTYVNDTNCAIPESQKLQEDITHIFFNNLEYLLITDYSDFYIKVALISNKSINLAITSILPNNHGYLTFMQSENFLLDFSYIHHRQYTRNGVTLEKIQFDIDSLFIFEYTLFKYQNVHYNIMLDGKSRHIDPTCIEHFFLSVNNVKYEKVSTAKISQHLYALDIYLLTMTIFKQKQRYFIFYSAFLHIYNIVNLDIECAKYSHTFYYDCRNLNILNQFAYVYIKHMKIYTEVAKKYERHLKRILCLINLNFFVQGTAINHTLCMVYNKYARSYIKFYINLTYITIRYLDYLYISNNTQKMKNLSNKFNLKYYLAISDINNTKFKEETINYYQEIIKNFIGDDLENALYNFYDLNDQNKKKTIFDCFNLQIETDLFFSKTVIDMLLELENILLNFYEKMYLEYSKSIGNPQLIVGVISADEYHDNNFARLISEQTFLKFYNYNPAKKQKTEFEFGI